MKQRCTNPKTKKYHNYGGRGITYCKEWESPEPFLKWAVENGYEEGLTLDRKNPDGNYEPSNCRWITYREQNINKRDTVLFEINGESMVFSHWCDRYKMPYETVRMRVKHGMGLLEALTTQKGVIPVGRPKKIKL